MRSSQYHTMLQTRTKQITEACRKVRSFSARSERHEGSPLWRASVRRHLTGKPSGMSLTDIRPPSLASRELVWENAGEVSSANRHRKQVPFEICVYESHKVQPLLRNNIACSAAYLAAD